ncbi:MAG: two-component system, OmpR family, sensor histidine kinase BaeS [Actinomycetota bacterium]|nr:two-component system, OmpR family, sensor histidine kinase BaeS [Actinomycetota bacterium]
MNASALERVRRPGAGLAGRLLVAQALVLLTGTLAAWLIAANVGPSLFHEHLARAAVGSTPAQIVHTEEAYRSANAISLSWALLAALVVGMTVNVLIARRIGRSVATIANAASDVASGHYDVRVPAQGLGGEFDALASGFNQMAGRLGSVEQTRRRLLADLGHEMRTPVATLEAYLEALEDGVATLDAGTAELLRSQTRRLARLSEDIGTVSRTEEGQVRLDIRAVHPESVIAAVVESVTEAFDTKGVRLVTDVATGLPELSVDPIRIGQVLGNLLDNALRHTPAGGTVAVSATTSRRTGGAELTVADTGEGIPAEHLTHVFERFYRVDAARDRAHGGSGIGLAIAKALVEAQGGQLTATSAGTGQGSTFCVLLPRR